MYVLADRRRSDVELCSEVCPDREPLEFDEDVTTPAAAVARLLRLRQMTGLLADEFCPLATAIRRRSELERSSIGVRLLGVNVAA